MSSSSVRGRLDFPVPCTARGKVIASRCWNVLIAQPALHDGCSFGNAGMIVPSHFIPLAAPGMVALGLKWMWNSESPFYIKPRFSAELFDWGIKFWRAANAEHVRRSAPLLRDLSFASRALFEEFAAQTQNEFGLVTRGLLMLSKTQHELDEEVKFAAQANQLGVPAEVLNAQQVAKLDSGVTMDVAGAVYFPKDAHFIPDRYIAALQNQCGKLGVRFEWSVEVERLKASARIKLPPCRHFARRFFCGRNHFVRRPVVTVAGARTRPEDSHPGRQRLQPHARAAARTAAALLHLQGSEHGRHADGFVAAFWRHDGDRRAERGHQSRARAGNHQGRAEIFSEVHAGRFRRHPAVARVAWPVSPDGLPYLGRTAKNFPTSFSPPATQ